MRVDPVLKARILKLYFTAGFSERRVAEEVNVSRSLVRSLLNGADEVGNRDDDLPFVPTEVKPYFCPCCQNTVRYSPCVICAAKKSSRSSGRSRVNDVQA